MHSLSRAAETCSGSAEAVGVNPEHKRSLGSPDAVGVQFSVLCDHSGIPSG